MLVTEGDRPAKLLFFAQADANLLRVDAQTTKYSDKEFFDAIWNTNPSDRKAPKYNFARAALVGSLRGLGAIQTLRVDVTPFRLLSPLPCPESASRATIATRGQYDAHGGRR
jgi:hypothetical protein